ncbi:MAG TPA: flagellar hook-length control protein FliK [Micropepsaceae bacterium]|nr:flagellar hook-length control protein FliK [Micropepsaceae bacterium]
MTTISPSPLAPAPAVGAVPAINPETGAKTAPPPTPQPAVVAEPDPILSALQKLAAAEAVLAQSVTAALPTAAASQGGLAPLMADLVQAQQIPDLPASLQAAIVDVLALRSPIDAEVSGADIKAALTKSGLFSEAKAAAGLQATNAGAQVPPAGTDIKTALLVLRQVLKTWLSDATQAPASTKDAAPEPSRPPANNSQPPTYRGDATKSAQPPIPNASAATVFPATNPQAPVKTAQAATMPPQAPIISSAEPKTGAPQNLAKAEAAPVAVAPRSGTTAPSAQVVPPSADIKPAPPGLQQGAKTSLAGTPAKPDALPTAKYAGPESLRAPANTPPPITRAPANAPPAVAPTSSTPVFSPLNPQTASKAPQSGTSQPQPEFVPAFEGMAEEAPAQAAKAQTASSVPQAAAPGATAPPSGPDLKSAMIVIQQFLKASLDSLPAPPRPPETGKNPAPESTRLPANNPPPPPYRGGPTSAQPSLPSMLTANANPWLVGEVLLSHTEAALAHLKLLQIASLPEAPQGTPHHEDQGPRWMFEIPFSTPQGSAIAQFEIRRDGGRNVDGQSGPVWRARFSLDVEPIGPVHAHIAMMGERAWVTLWAEREAGLHILSEKESLLSQALKDSDVVAEVAFCFGAPQRRVAAAGQFLDRAS